MNKNNLVFRYILSSFFCLCVMGLFIFTGCSNTDTNNTSVVNENIISSKIAAPSDLNKSNMIIAGETEILATREAKKYFNKAQFLEFATPPDCFLALSAGKVNAIAYDRPALEYASYEHNDLLLLPDNIAMGHISVAASLDSKELISQVNDFIRYYRRNGTYKDMFSRWVYNRNTIMPNIETAKNPDGKIVIGVDTDNVPMSFIQNGEHAGFDIEFARRLALYMNKKIEFKTITSAGLIQALQAGKIDLAIDQMDATEERRTSVLFSDEYIDSPIGVMIRKNDYASDSLLKTFNDLEGKKIGVLTGSTFYELAKKYLPPVKTYSYSQINQQVASVEEGKLDGFLLDVPQGKYLLLERTGLTFIPQIMPVSDYAFAFEKNNSALEEAFSREITKMKNDGTLKKLQDKWFSVDKDKQVMPEVKKNGKKLILGVVTEVAPFDFIRDGKIVGYEIEIVTLIANKLGYTLEILPMDFSGLISSLEAKKTDIIAGSISATSERRQSVLFSEAVFDGGVIVIVKKNLSENENISFIQRFKNFITSFKDSFNKTFIIENRWQLILQGLCVTVIITFFSVILGTILAFPVCMLSRSKNKFLSLLAEKYISIIQGTPILVILMILYYVVFAKVDINAIIVAIIAFGLDFAAYTGVMLRSGIEGIPKGQTEAALALGFTPVSTFFNFILPQAVRSILPVYRSEIISTLKATSIVGYIAIMDLTKMSDVIRSRTYDAFFPLISTAIIYFLVAKCLTSLLILIENKVNPEYRRNKMLKRGVK